jgi:hypothetical protein
VIAVGLPQDLQNRFNFAGARIPRRRRSNEQSSDHAWSPPTAASNPMPLRNRLRITRPPRTRNLCSSTFGFLPVGTRTADVSARLFRQPVGLDLRSFYPDPRIPARPKNP